MTTSTQQKVATQLFIGCVITPDIRIALNQSKTWRQAKIGVSDELKEQRYHNKDYLGLFVPGELVTLEQIAAAEASVRTHLHEYCSEVDSDAVTVYILSILLIS